MLCGNSLKIILTQVESIGTIARGTSWVGSANRVLPEHCGSCYCYSWSPKLRRLRSSVKMMVDRGCTVSTLSVVEDDDGYITGGCKSEDGKLSYGYSSFQGRRFSMEDFYDVKMSDVDGKTVCLFGIFDGHGGSRAAEYLKQHLFENLIKHPQFMMDTKMAISETYKKIDTNFLDSQQDTIRDDGSTASAAILFQNHLYVANVGDSRAVISKAGKAIPLSEDQKPNRADERKRIESAGGVVMWAGTWRVGGVLAMSRAFGNRMLKQFVVAEPEIQEQEVDEDLELIVLASDGLWDVVPNEDAVSIARAEEEPESAARKLTQTAFARGSADNITCIVVKFNHNESEPTEPQLEHSKEIELHQNKSEGAEKQQGILPREVEILEDPSKDPEVKQGLVELDAVNDQTTETKLGSEKMEDSPAYFGGEESLASV